MVCATSLQKIKYHNQNKLDKHLLLLFKVPSPEYVVVHLLFSHQSLFSQITILKIGEQFQLT